MNVYGSKHVRLLSVPFHFHRSWPQDAVERTRTVASGEAAGNDSFIRSRYLPRINLAERRKASKEKCRREWERKTADPQISISSRVLSPIWYSWVPTSLLCPHRPPRLLSPILSVPVHQRASRSVALSTASFVPSSVIMTPDKNCQCCVCGVSASTHALGVSKVYNALLDTFSYMAWHLNPIIVILSRGCVMSTHFIRIILIHNIGIMYKNSVSDIKIPNYIYLYI